MKSRERLIQMLFADPERRHLNIKFFRGHSETISDEDLCSEVATALFEFDNDLLDSHGVPEEKFKTIDVKHLSVRG